MRGLKKKEKKKWQINLKFTEAKNTLFGNFCYEKLIIWRSWDCFCYWILLHLDNLTCGNFPGLCVGLACMLSKSCWFYI